jgi:hypothetical protein
MLNLSVSYGFACFPLIFFQEQEQEQEKEEERMEEPEVIEYAKQKYSREDESPTLWKVDMLGKPSPIDPFYPASEFGG